MIKPDYIFESSWEVCNKVGGIYTVLSTRAKTLQDEMKDHIIFIGPDCWKENDSPYFREEKSLFAEWQWEAKEQGLKVKVGRWTVPGEPIAILVDFTPYFEKKDQIYTWLWEKYAVDSLHAYGDYDEASMFSYAAALVTESFYQHYKLRVAWELCISTTNCPRLAPSLRRMQRASAVLLLAIRNPSMTISSLIMATRWLVS